MLARLVHFVVGLLGLLLLYLALFLTETAEGGIQNRLEVLWVRVDDLSKTALSKQAAFLQQVSGLLGAGFDRLFGEKLLSAKSAATSISLSLAAVFLFLGFFQLHYKSTVLVLSAYPDLGVGVFLLALGLSPVPMRYLSFLIWPAVFGYALDQDWELLDWDVRWLVREFGPAIALVLGSIASDILFIAASRWYLRKSAKMSNGWRNLTLVLFSSCLALLLISPVVTFFVWPQSHGVQARALLRNRAVITVLLIGISNLLTAAVPVFFALLCAAAVLHLVFWPVLEAPIYSAQRYGLVRQSRLLGGLGVMCLLFAWPSSPLIALIARLMHGG